MSEQTRIPRDRQKRRLLRRQEQASVRGIEQASVQSTDSTQKETEDRLNKLDAAINELDLAQATAAGPSVVVGQQKPDQVVKPSDEELVSGFHQTSGE